MRQTAKPDVARAIPCPHPRCDELNAPAARFCARCGHPLGPHADALVAEASASNWWAGVWMLIISCAAFIVISRVGGVMFGFIAFGVGVPVATILARRQR